MVNQKEQVQINKSMNVLITDKYKTNQNLIIKPIVIYGDLFGSIILFSEFDSINTRQETIDLIHHFCSEYIQI